MMRAASLPFVVACAALSLGAAAAESRRRTAQAPARPAGPEARTTQALASVKRDFSEVKQLALQAKQEGDSIRLACINDQVDKIVRLLTPVRDRLAEQAKKPRDEKTRAAEAERRSVEMTGIARTVAALRAQAGACMGQKKIVLAEKSSPAVREEDDPTYEPVPPSVGIRPPPASRY